MDWVRRLPRLLASAAGVEVITWFAYRVVPVNATTVGFFYLLYVLILASTWGVFEATVASILATLSFNFFFLEPKLTFTIADPQNWVALFAFLATSIIASRLSAKVRRRELDAVERRQDLERLYTFGRAILLIDNEESFAKELARRLAETFELEAVALYDSRSGEIYRAGPAEFVGMETQLRESALQGSTFSDPQGQRVITAVRLGSAPIASLALQGARMQDSVVQSISNLTAIGLERARAQHLAHEVEVATRSERLRTTLLDAMAHELKTPLTSIRAATTALVADHHNLPANAAQMLKIADEEAAHLEELIDNALDMAQLDSDHIDVDLEDSRLDEEVQAVIASMDREIGERRLLVENEKQLPSVKIDRRLLKLAIKQVLNNALKYSPVREPVSLRLVNGGQTVALEVTDHGQGIPEEERGHIFERFYRSPSVETKTTGSGLGLSIAKRILQAHKGALTFESRPGKTTFRLTLPVEAGATK